MELHINVVALYEARTNIVVDRVLDNLIKHLLRLARIWLNVVPQARGRQGALHHLGIKRIVLVLEQLRGPNVHTGPHHHMLLLCDRLNLRRLYIH